MTCIVGNNLQTSGETIGTRGKPKESLHDCVFTAKAALENAKHNGVFQVKGKRIGNWVASGILRFVIFIQTVIRGAKLNADFFKDYYTKRLSEIYEKSNKARDNLQKELQDALSEAGLKLEGNTEASLKDYLESLKKILTSNSSILKQQQKEMYEGQVAALNKILGCESVSGMLEKLLKIQSEEGKAIEALRSDLSFMASAFLVKVDDAANEVPQLNFDSILREDPVQPIDTLDIMLRFEQNFANKQVGGIRLANGFEEKFNEKVKELTGNELFTNEQVEELLADFKEAKSRVSLSAFLEKKIDVLNIRLKDLNDRIESLKVLGLYCNAEKTKLQNQASLIKDIGDVVACSVGSSMTNGVL